MTEHRSLACRIPLSGSRLIEASAGTGKTFTISALYLRLVLGHGGERAFERALAPPEILVMTFTEAATFELKERIRKRLTDSARFFRDDPALAGDAFLRELRDDYPEADWPRCARVLEQAALWMDDAAISTIHSWCYRMLREHAFQSGSVFNPTLVTDHGLLLAELFKDYWRQQCYPLSPDHGAWMADTFRGPAGLAAETVLGGGRETAPTQPLSVVLAEALEAHRHALARLKQPYVEGLADLRHRLEAAIADKQVQGNRLRLDWLTGWMNRLAHWADSDEENPDLGSGWRRLTPDGIRDPWKSGEPLTHPLLEDLASLPARLEQLASPRQAVIDHARRWVQTRLSDTKRDRSEMGFDDMIHHLHQALSAPEGASLAETLRTQFPVALVDEFQDTDPIQYAILDHIYRIEHNDAASAVLMIGDPKQAIYGFRGADIHTYLRARAATVGRHYTLETNYRSTQAMVEAVNAIFLGAEQAQPEGAFLFRQGDDNPLPFYPVQASGRQETLLIDELAPAAIQWQFLDDAAPMAAQLYRETLSEVCASEITRLLNLGKSGRAVFADGAERRPVLAADIAVLVREGREADLVRQALARRGVRSVYLSESASVLHSAEANDLLHCLRACAEPGNERLLRAALATPVLGLSTLELDRLFNDELAWETEVLRFRSFQQCWQRQGVLPMLRALLQAYAIPAKLAPQTDGERRLTNLLHLSELLQQASVEIEGEQALIHHFFLQTHQGHGQSDETILRLESDAQLVKVVTVHKSKGLEYPLVFLPFAARSRALKQGEQVRTYDADGVLRTHTLDSEEARLRADRERLAEDLRLLYVALTRARHACWVGLADVRQGRSATSQLPLNAWGHVLEAQQGEQLKARIEALSDAQPRAFTLASARPTMERAAPDTTRHGFTPQVRQFLRPDWPRWGISSYSALKFGALPLPDAQQDLDFLDLSPASADEQNWTDDADAQDANLEASPGTFAVEEGATRHDFARGPQAGTFLHGLLEWCAEQGFAQTSRAPEALRDQIARRSRVQGWEGWIDGLTDWMLLIIDTPLPLGDGVSVALSDLTRYQCELEFWFEVALVRIQALDALVTRQTFGGRPRPQALPQSVAGMLKGFMDLVFEHEGRYYVLDYKSNALGRQDSDYDSSVLQQAVLDRRYDLQSALYALALHRHLRQRLPDYDPARHLGGVVYYFFRGVASASRGVLFDPLEPALLDALDDLMLGVHAP